LITPKYNALQETLKDKYNLLSVDVDESKGFSEEFGVTSVPTIIVLEESKEINRHVGYIDDDGLQSFITNS
jgi:thioredoxin-like negative regulator of GroEL